MGDAIMSPESTQSALPYRRVAPRGPSRWTKISWRRVVSASIRYLVLIALGLVFAGPFIWMVSTSLTSPNDILKRDRPIIPAHPQWDNYKKAWEAIPVNTDFWGRPARNYPAFALFTRNTVLVSVLSMIGQTFTAAMVAYAFARLRFPFRNTLFLLVLSTMMLPPQVTMIPTFIMWTIPGWIDSLKPLIIPAFFGGGAFFIFLLRQFFLTIPKELEEAATIDGCGPFRIFWHVMLPLSKPALTTVALFSFIGHWNDFLGPLIYTQSIEKKTLAVGLNAFKTLLGTQQHLLMAASVAMLVPILVIFFFAQKYFVQSVVTSGVKG